MTLADKNKPDIRLFDKYDVRQIYRLKTKISEPVNLENEEKLKEGEYGTKENPHVFNRVLYFKEDNLTDTKQETAEEAALKICDDILNRQLGIGHLEIMKQFREIFIEAFKQGSEWRKQQSANTP